MIEAWDEHGRWLVVAGDRDGNLRVVDEEMAQIVKELELGAPVSSLCVTELDGAPLLLAGSNDGRLHVVRTQDWRVRRAAGTRGRAQRRDGRAARRPPSGRDSGAGAHESELRVWEPRGSGADSWVPRTSTSAIFRAGIARLRMVELDGRTVVVAVGDPLAVLEEAGGMVRLVDPSTGERIGSLDTRARGRWISTWTRRAR